MDEYQAPTADLTTPPKPGEVRFRIVPVIVCSLFVDLGGSVAFAFGLGFALSVRMILADVPTEDIEGNLIADPFYNWATRGVAWGMTALAGFVAARWAACLHVRHGVGVGITSLLLSIPFIFVGESESTFYPAWVTYASMVAVVPLGALGGWLARPPE